MVVVVLDMFVLDRPDAQAETLLLTILAGDPQRTLLPFFDPRDAAEIPLSMGFRDVVAGTFHTTTNHYRDLFTVEESGGTTAGATRTYLMEPDTNGAVSVVGVGDSLDLTTCHGGTHTGAPGESTMLTRAAAVSSGWPSASARNALDSSESSGNTDSGSA